MTTYNFAERTILITGATGGIGASISELFANSNAKRIILSGTNDDKLNALKSQLNTQAEVITKSCDLSITESIQSLTALAVENEVDTLICNAGITKDNLLIRMKEAEWDDVISVNLKSSFLLSQGLSKAMMKKRFGRIVFISSVVGQSGNPGQANYVASKSGLIGLSKSVAIELASRNITSNCVAPGFIKTQMTDSLTEAQREDIIEKIPAGKYGEPSDVASTVAFLASQEASYITGHTINVNGGMYT